MTTDFGDMADRVGKLRDRYLPEEHEKATNDATAQLRDEVENNVRQNDSVARKNLVNDVQHDKDVRPSAMVAHAVSVPEWGKYLEHGTGLRSRRDTLPDSENYPAPSPMPPFEAIMSWVLAKNITPRKYDSKYALAEAIQKRIGEVGTFPHPFMRPAWWGTYGRQYIKRQNRLAQRRALRRM